MNSSSALTAAKTVIRWLRWAAVLALVYYAWGGLLYFVLGREAWALRPGPLAVILQQMVQALHLRNSSPNGNTVVDDRGTFGSEGGPMFRELEVGQSALLTDIAMCINYYRLFSPGLYCCIHAAVQMDDGTRLCPGIVVQVNHGPLKQCEPNDCFTGPPNFVLDVFPEGDMLDYEHKRDCFERHGVIEYVALRLTEPVEWIWNRLIDGKFSVIETADNELIMSTALPGLWIPSHALKHRDWWAIMGAIARGVSRVGHHDFMDTIWKAGKNRTQEEIRQAIHDYQSGRMGRIA
jgi:hypothetical protein